GTLNAYAQQIGTLRLVAHGVDPTLLRPLIVDDLDVSTSAGRSVLLLGTLTYFLLFATLTGGMHLAIDTTAGERERKSLEPLLAPTLPVIFAAIVNVEPSPKLMWIPSLSQHLLVTTLIKAQPLDPTLVALSAGSTLVFAAILAWVATRLYRREAILG